MTEADDPEDTCLIHVGKCGGSTIRMELTMRGMRKRAVHLTQPEYAPGRGYWFLARDPVDRFVSAFRWRHYLFTTDRLREPDGSFNARNAAERDFLQRHARLDELALALPGIPSVKGRSLDERGVFLIGHVGSGFAWYYDDLLDRIEPSQVLGVIALESIDEDCEAVFGFRPALRKNADYPHEGGELSEQGRAILTEFFSGEYATLRRLSAIATAAGAHVPASLR